MIMKKIHTFYIDNNLESLLVTKQLIRIFYIPGYGELQTYADNAGSRGKLFQQ